MITRRQGVVLALLILTAFTLTAVILRALRKEPPESLTDLAARTRTAGWRIEFVRAHPNPEGGFYALPPGDSRTRDEIGSLRVGGPGWKGAVLVTAPWTYRQPVPKPAYHGQTCDIYGEPDATLAFVNATDLP
jgi:hypothetical protein